MRFASLVLALFSTLAVHPLRAAETQSSEKVQVERFERIGGTYKVKLLEKRGEDDFIIHFESVPLTQRYDHLVLRADHVHMSIQEGQTLRISAEIVSSDKPELEITQVLLFLSNSEYGTTPIWLLSSQHVTKDFRGSRWLDMHAPQADFQIL